MYYFQSIVKFSVNANKIAALLILHYILKRY